MFRPFNFTESGVLRDEFYQNDVISFTFYLAENCPRNASAAPVVTWLLESVSPNCLRTNRWSLASCTQAWAAPREQDAVGTGI